MTQAVVTGDDLVYDGAFRCSPLSPDANGRDFRSNGCGPHAGCGAAYDAANNGLLISTSVNGTDGKSYVGRVSIPPALIHADWDPTTLNASDWQMAMTDYLGSLRDQQTGSGFLVHRGMLVDGTKTHLTLYKSYDGGPSPNSHAYIDAAGVQHGMYSLAAGQSFDRQLAGWITPIPAAWQAALGGNTHLSGNSVESIVGSGTVGCTAAAFKLADIGVVNPVPAKLLTHFDVNHQQPDFSLSGWKDITRPVGCFAVNTPTKQGLCFIGGGVPNAGVTPVAATWYGERTYDAWRNMTAVNPLDPIQGWTRKPPTKPGFSDYATQAGPLSLFPTTDTENRYYSDPVFSPLDSGDCASNYCMILWVVDFNDLVKSFNGVIANPWDVPIQRYEIVNANPFLDLISGFAGNGWYGSVTHDPAGNRIWTIELNAEGRGGGAGHPLAYQWRIRD